MLDAAYKAASPTGYANADHCEMLAYCAALAIPAGLAHLRRGPEARTRQIGDTTINVVERPLDVSRHPRDVLRQIDRLADEAIGGGADSNCTPPRTPDVRAEKADIDEDLLGRNVGMQQVLLSIRDGTVIDDDALQQFRVGLSGPMPIPGAPGHRPDTWGPS